MIKYAFLNQNNIAETILTYGQVLNNPPENYIKVEDDSMLWHKYENNQWSTEKYEPTSTAPLTEFEQLKQNQNLMKQAIDDLILSSMGGAL